MLNAKKKRASIQSYLYTSAKGETNFGVTSKINQANFDPTYLSQPMVWVWGWGTCLIKPWQPVNVFLGNLFENNAFFYAASGVEIAFKKNPNLLAWLSSAYMIIFIIFH